MKLPAINLRQEELLHFDEAIQKEWLLTNGLGGFASSTVLGINTRKYHGLLVAALSPPVERRVCLEKLDEEICIGNNIYPLGANEFRGRIFPRGYIFLKEFAMSPFPQYVYDVENVKVEKTIFMLDKKNAVIILYNLENKNDFDVKIRVYPLINCRHFHSVTDKWKNEAGFVQKKEGDVAELRAKPPRLLLAMRTTLGRYYVKEKWVENVFYREEASRGESCFDDLFQPGYFEMDVKAKRMDRFAVMVAADKNGENVLEFLEEASTTYDAENMLKEEIERLENFLARFHEVHPKISVVEWLNWIVLATDSFIVRGLNAEQRFVIAGYHWFEAWGRDTFVSLPGLMLVTNRFEDAKRSFLTFNQHIKDGLIPNFVPDQPNEPSYNAADATLWYMNAVLQYLKYTGDFKFVQEDIWERLKAVIESHVKGTTFNIRVDSDCLLHHGPQLTWMDAVVDEKPVTPRAGKAVEIQALWYNALKTMELLANKFGEKSEAEKYFQLAEGARKAFVEKFWNPEKYCLFDVVGEGEKDESIRPNQIIAVSLDFTMLDNAKKEKIVDVVHRELLTPYGLRTLAKSDPKYIGVYEGDRRKRDIAYHNGTVWAWLLGPFTTAFLRTKGYAEHRREYALKNFLLPLFTKQVYMAGLGTLSEISDGDPPHTPRGCIAQAWSIAEPFRAYVEDVLQIRPKYEKEVLQGFS
ncbi:MAG: amylo-alpha-1,6-glucosidase [Candidatus Bathycorpusculaceae bacterium]